MSPQDILRSATIERNKVPKLQYYVVREEIRRTPNKRTSFAMILRSEIEEVFIHLGRDKYFYPCQGEGCKYCKNDKPVKRYFALVQLADDRPSYHLAQFDKNAAAAISLLAVEQRQEFNGFAVLLTGWYNESLGNFDQDLYQYSVAPIAKASLFNRYDRQGSEAFFDLLCLTATNRRMLDEEGRLLPFGSLVAKMRPNNNSESVVSQCESASERGVSQCESAEDEVSQRVSQRVSQESESAEDAEEAEGAEDIEEVEYLGTIALDEIPVVDDEEEDWL